MKHKLAKLTDHVIVCGSGRMGRLVAQALIKEGVTVVLVDRDEQALGALKSELIIGIGGDASSDELLAEVGITRARALVATLGSDADNVFLTLSARALSPKLFIVSRAVEEGTEAKLVRAGANRVVAPFAVGGFVAANAILHPAVLDSLDLAQRTGHLEVQVERDGAPKGAAVVRAPLIEARLASAWGADRRAAPHQPRRGLQPPRRHRPLGERHPRRHGAAARARSAGALDSRLLRVRPHPSPGPRPLVR
ncbi:MAG: NAD-binding protein [Deltaproteobacteria bacterium]|nr:NAD-binding protein [Deltaproteobacteria bacterium]